MFVKTLGSVVACPNVQGDKLTAHGPGIFGDMAVEGGSDALAPAAFLHAQIVDVKLLPVGQDGVTGIFPQDAEAVAQDLRAVSRNENGTGSILQEPGKGGGVVFLGSGAENIRTDIVMDLSDLPQQAQHAGNVVFRGWNDVHKRYLLAVFGYFIHHSTFFFFRKAGVEKDGENCYDKGKDVKHMDYVNCTLCPRQCGVNRSAGQTGFCGCGDTARVAKAMVHKWEEPALAGEGGSGAIFFGGCTLGCWYCQNREISGGPVGGPVDGAGLRRIMEDLIARGAENIDLVTPTHFLPTVAAALEEKLPVPVVYNCGGYERVESLKRLEGKVDIYLPDLKYADAGLARALSGAGDYFPVAAAAIREMVRQTGPVRWEGEKVVRGVIVRHLILPGFVDNSLKVLDWLGEQFAPGEILVSLMRQYTPMPGLPAPLNRRVTDEEYDAVLSWMYLNDLEGFTQEADAADSGFIPDF